MLDASLYPAIAQVVSLYLGRVWQVQAAQDMTDYARHPCAILADGSYAVFAKYSAEVDGYTRFQTEMAGLRLLATRGGASTPAAVGIASAAGGNILVLEAVQAVPRTAYHWRQIGQALAQLHKVKDNHFGLATHSYFGPLFQDNTPARDWNSFYVARRLRPALRLAVDAGTLPPETARQVEQVIARLPELGGPPVVPSLLHGDAQQNNFISTEKGAFMVDPAAYFGHPEMDLAYVDFFAPVSDQLYAGYEAEHPIDPGLWARRGL